MFCNRRSGDWPAFSTAKRCAATSDVGSLLMLDKVNNTFYETLSHMYETAEESVIDQI